VNAYFCGQCGAKMPPDSVFCPMCGFRTGGSVDIAPGAHPNAIAAQPIAPQPVAPQPIAPQPIAPQPIAPWSMGARRTPVHGERVPDPFAYAGVPGVPEYTHGDVGITRRPGRMAAGALAVGLAAVVAIWVAAGDPGDEMLVGGSMSAAALALAGIGLVLTGAFHRAAAQVRCRRCARPVLAWKGAFGLHCPLAPHHARVNWFLVAITAAFWLGLAVTMIGMLIWLAF
jgi:hypothetical protein